jgi:hypothetical protein
MRRILFTLTISTMLTGMAHADPPADAIKTIQAVGSEGAGNDAAMKAWKVLVQTGDAAMLPMLEAFDGATPTAANWLRSAISAVADRSAKAGRKPVTDELVRFVSDTKRNAAARRIAFQLIEKADKSIAEKMLPTFLNDTQPDLRRIAVSQRLTAATPLMGENAIREYREVLGFARDDDQVQLIAKKLKELKAEVNLTKHYGFITEWLVSPTFDNKDGAGFATAYEPEQSAERKGWVYAQSNDPAGLIDLDQAIGKKKNVVVYAAAVLTAEADSTIDIRAASQNAVKIFANGKEVYFREEYHHGSFLDQHTASVKLTKGKNEILIKVCQNDQKEPWAQVWAFSARLSDSTGAAVRLKQNLTKDGTETTVEVGELAPPETKKTEEKKEDKK